MRLPTTLGVLLLLAVVNSEKSTSGTINPENVTRGSGYSGCMLPEQPVGGSYELDSCIGSSCNVVPGMRVPSGSLLTYKCNDGYLMQGNSISFCHFNVWFPPPTCVRKTPGKNCSSLRSETVDFDCKYYDEIVSCESPIASWTKATPTCKKFHKFPSTNRSEDREFTCLENGEWDRPVVDCVPECGIAVPDGTQMIRNGFKVKLSRFPWRVDIRILNETSGPTVLRCQGALVSPSLVVSGAWCFTDQILKEIFPGEVELRVGTYEYNFADDEPHIQRSLVDSIDLAQGFDSTRGKWGTWNSDVALLHAKTPFNLTTYVRPICLDWDNIFASGKWNEVGYNDAESKEITLPYMTYRECISAGFNDDPKGYVRADSFCTELRNESSSWPCTHKSHGDGFACEYQGHWYLLGHQKSGKYMRNIWYAKLNRVFTNIEYYLDWIRAAFDSSE